MNDTSELDSLLVRIQCLVVLVLGREEIGSFRVEGQKNAFVCDLILGKLQPALGLRRIFLVCSVEGGESDAQSGVLL